MGLKKRPGTDNWWVAFQFKGKLYQKSAGTANKREAEAFERKWRSEIESAANPEPAANLVPDTSALREMDFARARAAGRSDSYIKAGLGAYWKHLVGFFPSAKDVTSETLDHYVAHRKKEGAAGQTIKKELVVLKRGLTMAWERELAVTIPRRWPSPSASPPKKQQAGKFHGQNVTRAFVAALDGDAKDLAIVALHTGLRWAELYRIEASWIEETEPGDCVPAVLRCPMEATKTKRERVVGLVPAVYALLLRRAKDYPRGPLFRQQHRQHEHGTFAVASRRAGAKTNISLRDMRATFATAADAANDPRGVDLIMGHAGGVPARYQKSYVERVGKIALVVAQWLGPMA